MDFRRIILYFALALVGVALWNSWLRDYPPKNTVATTASQQPIENQKPGEYTPPSFDLSSQTPTGQQSPTASTPAAITPKADDKQTISVKTDVLDLKINTQGGNISSAQLPKYPLSVQTPQIPVQILSDNPENFYISQTGITDSQGASKPITFTSSKSAYSLDPSQNELQVVLVGTTPSGIEVTKTYIFRRNDYAISANITIKNTSSEIWSGSIYNQIIRGTPPPVQGYHARSYVGAAISSPDKPYEQISFKTLGQSNLSRNISNGWVAMQQQYFLSAWVPQPNLINHYYSQVAPGSDTGKYIYTIGYVSPKVTLKPGETVSNQSTFYVGPESEKRLSKVAKGLDLTIDYGWLWPVSKILFWIMDHIHQVIGNWGWSIVLVTLLIKVVFYPLSDRSYKSMAKMRALQPQIESLKQRYKDDKQALSRAMMELYKKEKINPMGGCLPMLIQIPVFIALYYVLIESVELRQAPFIFWIHDLSIKDPYYVLPILMGLSMLLQQKLSPQSPDPMQAKMMMLMPVVFTIFLLSFPSGLVLYWITNNLLSVLQQWYVMKNFNPKKQMKLKYKR